jgi:hypothetical protein
MTAHQVEAQIKYVRRGERQVFYPTDRAKSHMAQEEHTVTIRDVRDIAGSLSFDRNGFVLLRRPTAVRDFYDPERVVRDYQPEIEALVRGLTGAEKVICFGSMTRSDGSGTSQGNQPAFGAHVDYGARTVRDFTIDHLGAAEAERWLRRRHMLINLWRPIRTVHRAPLALADASTIADSDLFESEVRGGLGDPGRRSLFGFAVAYNPAHRWWYAPAMQPDEIWAFKLFDSDPAATQHTAHTAFSDPSSPPDAPPRESIEIRTISFMPE